MSSGYVWHGLPMIRIEDVFYMKVRIDALESTVEYLEDKLLELTRQARLDSVPRETEPLDGSSIYNQTLIDSAAPEARVGPELV
jgi:hypothetical protein